MEFTDLSISMGWHLTDSLISMGSATEWHSLTHLFRMALSDLSISMGSANEYGTHWFVNFHGVNYWVWHSVIHQFPWGQLLSMALTYSSISMGSTTETGTHWFVNFHGVNVSQTGSSSHSVLQHTRWGHHVSCEVERADPAQHHLIKNIIWLKRKISSAHSI